MLVALQAYFAGRCHTFFFLPHAAPFRPLQKVCRTKAMEKVKVRKQIPITDYGLLKQFSVSSDVKIDFFIPLNLDWFWIVEILEPTDKRRAGITKIFF